ncbi:MAG: sigma-54 dependent transcriptional regulator [Myxococcota bacterium]
MNDPILVVDDEAVLRNNLARYLRLQGYEVETAGSGEEALAALESTTFRLVLTDLRMPGMDGLALIRHLQTEHPDALTVLMTAYASVDSAVEALRVGASDYLLKPIALDALGRKVVDLLEKRDLHERVRRLRQEVRERAGVDLVGHSPAMAAVESLINQVAPTPANVLLEGESGTGKEVVARALHERSDRSDRDFIAVNLAAQPETLVDATLFGYEKGAYTGATGARDGVFRAARGGTVFLDEVGELPLATQTKLLRVIENREVVPLGSDRPRKVEFRLVAATNRPLRQAIDEGRFREDLYFRLNVMRIELPPLRQRLDDLPELSRRLLERHARSLGRATPRLTTEALTKLRSHGWPGNVRELSNVLERSVLLTRGPWIDAGDLPDLDTGGRTANLREAMERFERAHIQQVLSRCDGDKRQAAEALGVHLATLYRHIERLGIDA